MILRKIILNLLLLVLFISTTTAQSAISSSGGDSAGTGGSVSFTMGIVAFTTLTGEPGSVAQGVQQPYEISVLVGVELTDDITLEYSVYPNPATDILYLKAKNSHFNKSGYLLYDLNGNIIEKNRIVNDITHLDVGKLVPATYFLKVTDNKTEIKTFKFIKK